MTIVIDTTPLVSGHKARGIGRYTRSLVQALGRLETEHELIMTSHADAVDHPNLIHYPYFDLFHSHVPLFPPVPREVVTIHDLIPLRFKEAFKPGIRSGWNLWIQSRLVHRMAAVITDSEYSKRDIQEFLGVLSRRIHVVPLGVDSAFSKSPGKAVDHAREKYHLPRTYVLYVGDVNIHKNILALIEAVSGIEHVALVLVSQAFRNPTLFEVRIIHEAVARHEMNERTFFLDAVPMDPPDQLAAIYSGATVSVQPSLYEGFGLPVLEAMACGVPVVATQVASLPEVVGDAGVLCGTTSGELRGAIASVLKDEKLRERLREKGLSRAKHYTWERTAKMTLAVYESVLAH